MSGGKVNGATGGITGECSGTSTAVTKWGACEGIGSELICIM